MGRRAPSWVPRAVEEGVAAGGASLDTVPTPPAAAAAAAASGSPEDPLSTAAATTASATTASAPPNRFPLPDGARIVPVPPSGAQHDSSSSSSTSSALNQQQQQLDTRPFMLHLPDLDGAGLTTARHSWPPLSARFELWTLQLSPRHSGAFEELADSVARHLDAQLADAPPERPVYVLGEGFGGVLALAVALKSTYVQRLVLINPATCYAGSPLAALQPLLVRLPQSLLASATPLALAPALLAASDPLHGASLLLESLRGMLPGREGGGSEEGPLGVLSATMEQLRQVSDALPPSALLARLALLAEGVAAVEPQLNKVTQRVMIVAGGRDIALPSSTEAPRLAGRLQRAFVRLLPLSGHAPLSEPRVDVIALMEEDGFLVDRREFSSPPARGPSARAWRPAEAGPVELPSAAESARAAAEWTDHFTFSYKSARAAAEWTDHFTAACSPVFLSTMPDGTVVEGLAGLPADARPLLVVGNHQLCGQDINVLLCGQDINVLVWEGAGPSTTAVK
ncbi:hypothetical protein FOA52_012049 [Chlamydomonas sp. UWO 241]|nr:hypothetical protein FOA52_012049 [Chlamydomonas sp. UWO 241]